MDNLVVKEVKDIYYSPVVNFDAQTGVCELSGESYLENTEDFYRPILDWLIKYIAKNDALTFNFKLRYFNTSSSKSVLEILDILSSFHKKGKQLTVNWYYSSLDMKEEAEDFMFDTGIQMNLIKSEV